MKGAGCVSKRWGISDKSPKLSSSFYIFICKINILKWVLFKLSLFQTSSDNESQLKMIVLVASDCILNKNLKDKTLPASYGEFYRVK